MTRLEELTLDLADDVLTDADARELQVLLSESDQACQTHVRILQIEAGLRVQKQNLALTAGVMARLHNHVTESVARGVMTQIRMQHSPEWLRPRALRPDTTKSTSRILSFHFLAGWTGWSHKHAWIPLAACLALAAGLGIWFFGPTMGEPVLVEVQGAGLSIVRAGQTLSAVVGMRLQTADVLRTPTNVTTVIGFSPEATRVTLQPGTELKLAEMSRSKRFDLHLGKLEASVTRQRPFQPMIITTPQATARVLGTKFSLLTANGTTTQLDVNEGKVSLTRRRDGASVEVAEGRFAIVAEGTKLTALPQRGLRREWWTGVKGKGRFSLGEEARFPDRPDGHGRSPDFEIRISETNQFAVRLCGYVYPPVTGNYNFWLDSPPADFAAVGFANLMMSPTDSQAEAVQIAQTGGGSLISPYITVGTTAAPPPIPLVAGHRYYIEARVLIGRGEGQLSVTWQPPGQPKEVLREAFLSPWKPK